MVFHAMDTLFGDVKADERHDASKNKHKEEGNKWKTLDSDDWMKIREEMQKCTNPLIKEQPGHLINIVNGCVAESNVNVHNAVEIGDSMTTNFIAKLPDGFHKPLHSKVFTMETVKKGVKVGGSTVFDMEKIYGCLSMISNNRNLPLDVVISYELCPIPASIFDEYGNMRSGAKSVLVAKLGVLTRDTKALQYDIEIMDRNILLFHVKWHRVGTVQKLCENVTNLLPKSHEAIVVFDKYLDGSLKTQEHQRCAGTVLYPTYKLGMTTKLPTRS